MFLCFFFSSRRRHTRWPRDWSSDVCSSDLKPIAPLRRTAQPKQKALRPAKRQPPAIASKTPSNKRLQNSPLPHRPRSEERRVGKESRSRWWTHQRKERKEEKITQYDNRSDE